MNKYTLRIIALLCLISIPGYAGFHSFVGGGSGSGTDLTGTQVDNHVTRGDGTDTVQSSNVIIDDSGNMTAANSINLADDKMMTYGTGGTSGFIYETADANANILQLIMPEGGATDVPVFLIGDASLANVDLGEFDGETAPALVIASDSGTQFSGFGHTDSFTQISSTLGGFSFFDKNQTTGGYASSLNFTTGTRGPITPSFVNIYPSILFDLENTRTFDDGAQGLIAGLQITRPDLAGTAPGTTAFGAATLIIDGSPTISGADMDIQTTLALSVGSPFGWNASTEAAFSSYMLAPGITDGTVMSGGNREALIIGGPVDGSSVMLGNQVGSLDSFGGLSIDAIKYDSTGTMTLDTVFGLSVTAPIPQSGNVSSTDGPHALVSNGTIMVKPTTQSAGLYLDSLGTKAVASNLLITVPYTVLSGAGTVDSIQGLTSNIHTQITLECSGNTLFVNEGAGAGADMILGSRNDFGCTDDDTISFDWNGTNWMETSRVVR